MPQKQRENAVRRSTAAAVPFGTDRRDKTLRLGSQTAVPDIRAVPSVYDHTPGETAALSDEKMEKLNMVADSCGVEMCKF